MRDQAAQKLAHLEEFAGLTGIAIADCVVIGDGDNDVEIFRATGHGIAIGSGNEALTRVAWKQVQILSEIVPILDNPKQ